MRTKAKNKSLPVSAKPETVLVLRTCAADGSSSHGFKWPESGPVEAPDWKPTEECGNGLHGWLWGHGNWSLKTQGEKIKWLVLEVESSTIVDLKDKIKFPRANVLASFAAWNDAMFFIRNRRPLSEATTVATGYYGHASATGNYGHASATGYSGYASATGDYGHASATGYYGHASATGYYGHASATGDYGHASATGNSGHASATGDYGHASATGDSGWSIGGYSAKVKADKNGALTLLWNDGKRPRVAVAYVGEDGIKPDTWYSLDSKGKFIEVTR
jgi:hypothetical protein